MTVCIYCRNDDDTVSFTGREHVVPQSFGRFHPDGLVLNCVCDACNQFLGQTLDLRLGRDSREGLARFDHGIKSPDEYRSLGRRSSVSTQLKEGPATGAVGQYGPSRDGKALVVAPQTQVGFAASEEGPYEYFLMGQIPASETLEKRLESDRVYARLFGDLDALKAELAEKGHHFDSWSDVMELEEGASVAVYISGSIDHELKRAIAKIGFNYLARQAGAQVALMPQFDDIRSYIRYGDRPPWQPVRIDQCPVLGDEPATGLRKVGHIVTAEWKPKERGFLAQVSLFNDLRYQVWLARGGFLLAFRFASGHFFNLADMSVLRLGPGRR